jgi:hypothetical protein
MIPFHQGVWWKSKQCQRHFHSFHSFVSTAEFSGISKNRWRRGRQAICQTARDVLDLITSSLFTNDRDQTICLQGERLP